MSDEGMTIREWFEQFTEATGETPSHVLLKWDEWYGETKGWPGLPDGVVELTDVPAEVLDYRFDDGFGIAESPNLAAWSPSYVLFSDKYDGAEDIQWVPRSPTDHKPVRPGG